MGDDNDKKGKKGKGKGKGEDDEEEEKDDKDKKGKKGKGKGKGEEDEEKDEKKVSAKMQKLLDDRKEEEEKKIKEHDKNQLQNWEGPVKSLADIMDIDKLETQMCDMLLGYTRITDSFVGFPAATNVFKTSEAQAKVLVKVVKSVHGAMRKMQLDKMPEEKRPQVKRMVTYFFYVIQEAFRSYGKKEMDGKGIKLFQEALISIGFTSTAEHVFTVWSEAQIAESKAKEEADDNDKKGKKGKGKGKGEDDEEEEKKDKKEKDDKKKG